MHEELRGLYPAGVEKEGGDSAGSDDNPSEDCADPQEIARKMAQKKKKP